MKSYSCSTPDETGWYFYRKNRKSDLVVVFINDNGEAFAMKENGDSFLLDDFIGKWQKIESDFI
jgi:hypothetical protein